MFDPQRTPWFRREKGPVAALSGAILARPARPRAQAATTRVIHDVPPVDWNLLLAIEEIAGRRCDRAVRRSGRGRPPHAPRPGRRAAVQGPDHRKHDRGDPGLGGAGFVGEPLTSGEFERWGVAGRGRWVTVYANPGHVFMTVAGLRFDTSGRAGPRGSRWQTAQRASRGFVARHWPGL